MATQKRILIVDDEVFLLRSLTIILTKNGYGVRGELDANGALQAVQSEDFDLILLDLTLPDKSGLELLRELCALNPKVPILIFAANTLPETAQRARELGARGFINKPIEPGELIQRLDFYLKVSA